MCKPRQRPPRCISSSIQEWEEWGFFYTGQGTCSTACPNRGCVIGRDFTLLFDGRREGQDLCGPSEIVEEIEKVLQCCHNCEKAAIIQAASGAILDLPESYFDAVRPGILMYGHYPSKETSRCILPRQVMSLKTHIAHLRDMPGGHPISYGRRWITPGPTRIAVLPIGYADGLSRRLTNNGEVSIRGRRYPIVGTVTSTCPW